MRTGAGIVRNEKFGLNSLIEILLPMFVKLVTAIKGAVWLQDCLSFWLHILIDGWYRCRSAAALGFRGL